MKKKDIYMILAVLGLALGSFLALGLLNPGGKETVQITVEDESYGTYSLQEDQEISIGEGNRCIIQDGTVRMLWADCPDQLCVQQKPLDEKGQGSIICLPNKVVIEVVGAEEGAEEGLDAVAG